MDNSSRVAGLLPYRLVTYEYDVSREQNRPPENLLKWFKDQPSMKIKPEVLELDQVFDSELVHAVLNK